MNGFISVAEVRAEPKQPGFITVHTMVAQLPVQYRTFLGIVLSDIFNSRAMVGIAGQHTPFLLALPRK